METAILIALISSVVIFALNQIGSQIDNPLTIASTSLSGVGTESGTDRPAPPPKGGAAPSQ